jgi:hypothetical protein
VIARLSYWWLQWRYERMARRAIWHEEQAERLRRNIRRGCPEPTFWGMVFASACIISGAYFAFSLMATAGVLLVSLAGGLP